MIYNFMLCGTLCGIKTNAVRCVYLYWEEKVVLLILGGNMADQDKKICSALHNLVPLT
jgi:hypothetical protein